jgi:transposase
MVLSMKALTREEALKIYESGPEAVVKTLCELSAAVEQLERRVAELEQRLAKNSRNSHKPPSSDGFMRPQPKSLREPSDRQPGGQPGHEGTTLKMAENPDQVQWHSVKGRCECGRCLNHTPVIGYERRQVFDLPEIKMTVTEHRAEIKVCSDCAKEHKGFFPEDVKARVQYGPHLKALVVYLRGYQLLPSARTAELFRDIFQATVSEGTLDIILRESAKNLNEFMDHLKEHMIDARVAHFDETGLSVNGENHWLHSVSTPDATYYAMHPKRGTEAIDDIGILPQFQGTAVHDGWPAYFQYEQCWHGLCNAHHLRELIFVKEQLGESWAQSMINCLLKIKQDIERAKEQGRLFLSDRRIAYWRHRYASILAKGYRAHPWREQPKTQRTRGRPYKGKARCLVERLDVHQEKVLAFMLDFDVPFDNNLVERDVRMAKLKQKISGTFRSAEMAEAFCRIRSFISTVRKQGLQLRDALESLFTASSFTPLAMLKT